MQEFKEFLLRRLSHANKRLEETKQLHGDEANKTYNYFGGQTLGYWQGMVSAYENALDEIEELENK